MPVITITTDVDKFIERVIEPLRDRLSLPDLLSVTSSVKKVLEQESNPDECE